MIVRVSVDLEVTRHKIHAGDDVVEVWGYVGDYEVMTTMLIREALHKGIITDREFEAAVPAGLRKGLLR